MLTVACTIVRVQGADSGLHHSAGTDAGAHCRQCGPCVGVKGDRPTLWASVGVAGRVNGTALMVLHICSGSGLLLGGISRTVTAGVGGTLLTAVILCTSRWCSTCEVSSAIS